MEANLAFANTTDPVDGTRYRGFAVDADGNRTGFDQLPTVSIVVPNEQHDLHSAGKAACDAWLAANIKPYADWARDHDSLLIVTFDEDGSTNSSHGDAYRTGIDPILTLFYGPPGKVIPGRYDELIDHLNVLATLLDRYGLLDRVQTRFRAGAPGRAGRERSWRICVLSSTCLARVRSWHRLERPASNLSPRFVPRARATRAPSPLMGEGGVRVKAWRAAPSP